MNAWRHTCSLSAVYLSQILSWFAPYPLYLWQPEFSSQNLWRAFPSSLVIYVFHTTPVFDTDLHTCVKFSSSCYSYTPYECRVSIFLGFYESIIPGTKENGNKIPESHQAPNSLVIISFRKIWDFHFLVFWDFLLPSLILQTSVFQSQADKNKLRVIHPLLGNVAPQCLILQSTDHCHMFEEPFFWKVELFVIVAPLTYILFQKL